MASYFLTPRARADLDFIWDYSFHRWGRRRAEAYLRKLAETFANLASGTVTGRGADEVREGYFRYIAGSHVLFYRRPSGGPLEIVRILHQSMDVMRHL